MRIFDVDERDSSWERDDARYRVYFFGPGHGYSVPGGEPAGYDVRTCDIVEADLIDVLRFAQNEAGTDALYAVALVEEDSEASDGHKRGLIWLTGHDFNDDIDGRTRDVMIERKGRKLISF
ncbi:hypothetical protein EDF46_3533 [Frondihabitans sp. PhB188]|uniref:hypothetical protein n=1 Tax=Frondihabitans sp. PhB188 TaxID=2485200 RepID=UPI000F9B9F51|nr:hypothetical protein [Frondihabitans sp. PhB188]ROQ31021.1 hypothetical protein EDF46_3533 [Frondihabitans sp. PhB188]